MAIHQERIITAVNASIEYRKFILQIREWLMSPDQHPTDYLLNLINQAMVELDAKYIATITSEAYRFNRDRQRNIREKYKMQQKRIAAGVIPRVVSPMNPNATNTVTVRAVDAGPNIVSLPDSTSTYTPEQKAAIEAAFNSMSSDTADHIDIEEDEDAPENIARLLEEHRKPRPLNLPIDENGLVAQSDDDEDP